MMRFGGSPIMVAVPPMFPNSAIGISHGLGSCLIALHIDTITGPRSNIVETLSKNADKTASKIMSNHVSLHGSILLAMMSCTEMYSNTPVRASSETMIIIPHRSASVPWSIHVMIVGIEGKRCSSANMKSTAADAMNAINVRCTTSRMIKTNVAMRSTSATHTCATPIGPTVTTSRDKPTGSGQSV